MAVSEMLVASEILYYAYRYGCVLKGYDKGLKGFKDLGRRV